MLCVAPCGAVGLFVAFIFIRKEEKQGKSDLAERVLEHWRIPMTRRPRPMNINDTSTQLLFTTVPIVGITTEGTGVSGTGFFFSYDLEDGRKVPLLITNHHVLKDVIQGRFVINLAEGDAPSCETISVNFDKSFIEGRSSESSTWLRCRWPLFSACLKKTGRGPSTDPSTLDSSRRRVCWTIWRRSSKSPLSDTPAGSMTTTTRPPHQARLDFHARLERLQG